MAEELEWVDAPLDVVPESWVAPAGSLQMCKVDAITRTKTKGGEGPVMISVIWSITEGEYKGLQSRNFYIIGTEDDPDAEDPETWKGRSAVAFKNRFVGVLNPNLANKTLTGKDVQSLIDQPFAGIMHVRPARGDFAEANEVRTFYLPQDAPSFNDGGATTHKAPPKAAAARTATPATTGGPRPGARPAPRPPRQDEEEG